MRWALLVLGWGVLAAHVWAWGPFDPRLLTMWALFGAVGVLWWLFVILNDWSGRDAVAEAFGERSGMVLAYLRTPVYAVPLFHAFVPVAIVLYWVPFVLLGAVCDLLGEGAAGVWWAAQRVWRGALWVGALVRRALRRGAGVLLAGSRRWAAHEDRRREALAEVLAAREAANAGAGALAVAEGDGRLSLEKSQ